MRGVTIGIVSAPVSPPEVIIRTTSGAMTYWGIYSGIYPGLIGVGGSFDPSTLGSNGTLSNLNHTVTFSNTSSVLGPLPPLSYYWPNSNIAWEFLVNTDYDIQLGYFAVDGNPYIPDGSSQVYGHYYQRNGQIYGPLGTSTGASYTTGDIIGVVYSPDTTSIDFYKNGIYQGQTTRYSDAGSILASCVSTAPPPPPRPSGPEWWGNEGQTLRYYIYNGVYGVGPMLFYKKDVTRDSGGSGDVLTSTANTNSTPPVVNWLPNGSDPQPAVSISNLPTGEWTIDTSGQTPSYPSGGGVLQILGPGNQILTLVIVWDTNNYWNLQFNQMGAA